MIDGLEIFCVKVEEISEVDHAYQNTEIDYQQKCYTQLREKIARRGFTLPIVLYREGKELRICDGWHRWKIAKALNIHEIPCVIFNSRTECKPTPSLRW